MFLKRNNNGLTYTIYLGAFNYYRPKHIYQALFEY